MAQEPAILTDLNWFAATYQNFDINGRKLYRYRNNIPIVNEFCNFDVSCYQFNRYYIGSFLIDNEDYIDIDLDSGISIWPKTLICKLIKVLSRKLGSIPNNFDSDFLESGNSLLFYNSNQRLFNIPKLYSVKGAIDLLKLVKILSYGISIAIPCEFFDSINLCIFSLTPIFSLLSEALSEFVKTENISGYIFHDPSEFFFFEKTKISDWVYKKPDSISPL